MAHEITTRDGVFTVRKQAWHGLADVFDEYPTREEAQKLVHGWEPFDEPVYRRVSALNDEGTDIVDTYEEVEGFVLRTRSDDKSQLGVVSDTLAVVNNSELWDIAEVLEGQGAGEVQYETGGSLEGGKRVWLLVRMREPVEIKGDPRGLVIPYFALQNDHVGMGSFRGQAVMDRIVCANTARAADLFAEQEGTEFVFRHTAGIRERIDQAKEALLGWRSNVREYQIMMDHFTDTLISSDERNEFVNRFFPYPMDGIATDRVMTNIEKARETYLGYLNGVTCEGTSHTAAGLLNAAVEYLNHGRKAYSAETRFKRNLLTRQRLVSDATELIKEITTV